MDQGKFELVLMFFDGHNKMQKQILHGDNLYQMISIAQEKVENDDKFVQAELYFVDPKLIHKWEWSDKQDGDPQQNLEN